MEYYDKIFYNFILDTLRHDDTYESVNWVINWAVNCDVIIIMHTEKTSKSTQVQI